MSNDTSITIDAGNGKEITISVKEITKATEAQKAVCKQLGLKIEDIQDMEDVEVKNDHK